MNAGAGRPRPGLLDVLRAARTNPDLLRLQVACVAWGMGEGAYVNGLTVVAYHVGGTAALAVLAVVRALPSVLAARASWRAICDQGSGSSP